MDKNQKLDVGDVVELKSGGPSMTINEYYAGIMYRCVWFSEDERKEGLFSLTALKRVEED